MDHHYGLFPFFTFKNSPVFLAYPVVCVYVESLKSNSVSNLIILKKSRLGNSTYLELSRMPLRGYRPVSYILRKLFSRATLASQMPLSCLHRLEVTKLQNWLLKNVATIMQHILPSGGSYRGRGYPTNYIFLKSCFHEQQFFLAGNLPPSWTVSKLFSFKLTILEI